VRHSLSFPSSNLPLENISRKARCAWRPQSNALLSLISMINKILFSLLCLLQFSLIAQKKTLEYDFEPADFTQQENSLIAKEMAWSSEIEYGFLGVSGYSLDLQELSLEIRFLEKGNWQEWQIMNSGHNSEESARQTFVLDPFEDEIEAWQIRVNNTPIAELKMRFFAAPPQKKSLV
jgi:hypothetical protein